MSRLVQATARKYTNGLTELNLMVKAAERAVVEEGVGAPLVANNINFFTKSFLISTCAHLEMCIKDIVFEMAAELDERLSVASVPS